MRREREKNCGDLENVSVYYVTASKSKKLKKCVTQKRKKIVKNHSRVCLKLSRYETFLVN